MTIHPGLVRTDFGQGVSDQALFDKAAAIRTQVFQIEQGFDPEFDELDKESAIHFVAEDLSVVQHEGQDWCFDEDGQPHVGMQLTCESSY
ncbi:hypothetical protein WJX79_009274 [Trebouxia sp. C0005]